MSIQNKKGFTLIELMVVIVIIGILAAIAIPKLFGMSAKAKAQEVGPAAGTWAKLQLAYKMESGNWGTPEQISYKLPGNAANDATESTTSNFKYTVGETDWSAVSQFPSDPCPQGGEWKAEFEDVNKDTPVMSITSEQQKGCLSLTPNFYKIGCTNDEASTDPNEQCNSGE
jgi:prepilin-type N-terminal cleavage/methylation domain-containing protein